MIIFEEFKAVYLDYVARNRLWAFLQGSDSHVKLNDLMLLILEGEEKILQSFGLPAILSYSSLLQIKSLKVNFDLADISVLYDELNSEAKLYLTGSVKTDLELLNMAQKRGLYIDEVLPQLSLKLKAESYFHFLYDKCFLPGIITAQNFLEEIRIVSESKLSLRIHQLTNDPNWIQNDEYDQLSEFGLVYLLDFMAGYANFLQENEVEMDL